MQYFARQIVRFRIALSVVCLAVTALLYPISRDIQYDQSVRSLFAEDDPRLLAYESIIADFGGDATCLAGYTDAELLSAEGLGRLATFAAQLEEVPGVESVTSLADLPRPGAPYLKRSLAQWFATPGIDLPALRREVLESELYADQFVSRDGLTGAVLIMLDRQAMASGDFEESLQRLRRIAAENPQPARIVGTPVMISDTYRHLAEDSWVLTYVSNLAMMIVILFLFRNLRWVVLPILVVQVTLVWMRALMAVTGVQLSIVGSMTTALVTVISIAIAIHIAVRYREETETDHDEVGGLERTLTKVLPAVFWTCATTAVGFGALGVSRVLPVVNFAFVMAAASLFVGLASLLLVPGGVLLGRFRSAPLRTPGEETLVTGLGGVVRFVQRHSALTAVLVLGLLAVAACGFRWLRVETDFTHNFRSDSPILQGYRFVEERLGGAGVVELGFDAPESLTQEFLDRVRDCERQLRSIDGVTKVIGLTDFLDLFDRSVPIPAGGLSAWFSGDRTLDFQLRLLRFFKPEVLDGLWNEERGRMRLVLRVRERQTMRGKNRLVESIEQTARAALGEPVAATGLYVLLVYLIDSLLGDQYLAFGVSSFGILLMTTIAFRSLWLGLVAFLPNLIPIIAVLGTMGWLGIPINVATAMIGSISMGLVVDFSIHYLNRFLQERSAGADVATAIAATHRSTGKAMVFANLALMLGFSVLVFSNFVPTIHFGMLVSVAILGGLLGNLLMLPVLLRLVYAVPRSKK